MKRTVKDNNAIGNRSPQSVKFLAENTIQSSIKENRDDTDGTL